ncbi:MAG: hypothetical protein JST00_22790 [Deltaproteobacteria bacterium]|nr:hypothetical protein [Deltaproteobacteria bacterium]
MKRFLPNVLFLLLAAVVAPACGSDGEKGPPGEPGAPGNPGNGSAGDSISLVTPRFGVLDRKAQITIAVDALKLTEAAGPVSVDLGGEGVKVGAITVLNEASLVVDLQIAAEAKVGLRDVNVLVGEKKLVATGGFEVVPALETKVSAGKAEQGGLVRIDFRNRDRFPLAPDTFRLSPKAPVGSPSLSALARAYLTETDGQFVMLGDPLAKTGALQLEGVNDPEDPDSATFLTSKDAVDVAARTPKTLTAGTGLAGEVLGADYATGFYKFAAPADAIVDVRLSELGTKIQPVLDAIPSVGILGAEYDYRDPNRPGALAYVTSTASSSEFLVVSDAAFKGGGVADFKFKLDVVTIPGTVVAESATAHPAATPQDLGALPASNAAKPALIVKGEIAGADTADVYQLDGGGTSKVQLVGMTDANLTIRFHPSNPACPNSGSSTLDIVLRAGAVETAATVGTGYVCVTPSQGAKGKYTIAVRRLP